MNTNNIRTPRIHREKTTVQKMIQLYCRGYHAPEGLLCPECQDLLNYANFRIDHCPYEDEKPICAKCPIHCYRPTMREKIRQVMRYAGVRMLRHHPYLTIQHLLDGLHKAPELHLRF